MKPERGWRWDVPYRPKGAREAGVADLARQAASSAAAVAAVGESSIHDFIAAAAVAVDRGQLERALDAAVGWASGGCRATLVLNTTVEEEDGTRGASPTGAVIVPVRAGGGKTWGAILMGRRTSDSPAATGLTRRRLESLATIAALGFERLDLSPRQAEPAEEAEHQPEPTGAVHDATLLSAVLPFALGQARRHKEPLSVLCVAINQLRGVRELFGAAEAERVVAEVGGRIAAVLRSSDLVCRLDDDRMMVVLPRAELRDAVQVGEKLVRKVAESGDLLGIPMAVTLAVGAASIPTTATTLGGLLDAADLALGEARRHRSGGVAVAPPIAPGPGRGDDERGPLVVADRNRSTC